MDFKKLGERAGRFKKQAEDKLGDRAETENLKRDGKELRNIMSGDGSLAEKAKEAKEKLVDRDPGAPEATEAAKPEPAKPDAPATEKPPAKSDPSDPSQ